MILPDIIYIKLLLKVNKGNSQGNIAIDKEKFVLIFNEVKNRWVESHLKHKDSILIDSIWEIVKTKELSNGLISKDYVDFEAPEDFYELILGKAYCKKGICKKELFLREVKNQDKNTLYFNINFRPDWDFEWSFLSLQDKYIRVYKTDFDIEKIKVEYYKVIPDIDIEGYIHLDGTPSTNIGIDLSEQYVDQIISMAAEEFMRNSQNNLGLQIAKDRTKNKD